MTELDPTVLERARSGDPIALTRALVATPSVNPVLEASGTGEEAVARLAAGWLREWGYDVSLREVAPGRWNAIGRRGDGNGPALLLNGHLDTVGVEDMDAPFSAALEGGRILGRGSCDMKAGDACILATAAALADTEIPGELIVALTADEEHASVGMQALVDDGARADAAVVCEPTELKVMPAHKGFLWVDYLVQGRAAHGSRPEVGIDAIVHAGHVLMALEAEGRRLATETHHPLLAFASLHAGTIEGGSAPSVYPADCRIVVERRTLPGESEQGVTAELEALLDVAREACPDLEARMEPGLFRAGTEVSEGSPLVSGLVAACRRAGLEGTVEGMTAWVDACFLNEAGVPAVCFGPGSIAQAHTVDEWVEAEQVTRGAEVLTDFARRFLGSASV